MAIFNMVGWGSWGGWYDWPYDKYEDDYSAMRWPCPEGFHVPTRDEMQSLIDKWVSLWAWNTTSGASDLSLYLKLPPTWYRSWPSSTAAKAQATSWFYHTCNASSSTSIYFLTFYTNISITTSSKASGRAIRPFKDTPVIPDSNWTTLYTWTWDAGIFHNSTLWLISIQNGNSWITISDKNLWDTNVLDNWLFYQFWNNTWYTYGASPYVTSKPTLNNEYWPGNYYTGSFVRVSSGNNWFNWTDNNIWWWVTNGTWTE